MAMNQADSSMQQIRSNEDDTETIDLGELFGVLWHRIWLLILVAAICGTAGYCIARFAIPEQYESTTEIYILNKSDASQNTVNYNDLQVGTQLTKDYSEMITSRKVLEQVIQDLGLDYDYDEFKNKVEVTTPTDTRIVAITVTDTDPAEAQRIANEIRVDASQQIEDVMEIDAVNVVEEANLPTEKSSPINSRWAIIGALIGFLVMAVIIVVQYIMDDTIKTSDDIEKYLGLSTLALIPLDSAISENSVEEKSQKKRGIRRTSGKDDHHEHHEHHEEHHHHEHHESPAHPETPGQPAAVNGSPLPKESPSEQKTERKPATEAAAAEKKEAREGAQRGKRPNEQAIRTKASKAGPVEDKRRKKSVSAASEEESSFEEIDLSSDDSWDDTDDI